MKTALVVLPMLTLGMFTTVNNFHQEIPQPVRISEDSRLARTEQAIRLLGRKSNIAEAIYSGATANKLDPVLVATLIETESEFNIRAKSNKGYMGLLQTPVAIRKQGFEEVDVMLGCCILKEKLRYADGNMLRALQLYKGGNNPVALKQAQQVLKLYSELKYKIEKENENENKG